MIWTVWDADKRIGMLKKMTQLDIYLCTFFSFILFLIILSSFISFITKKATAHVPSRNNLIFQSIPQSVDKQQNYLFPKYIYLSIEQFICFFLLCLHYISCMIFYFRLVPIYSYKYIHIYTSFALQQQ